MFADFALPLTAAGSSAAWAQLAARRAGHRHGGFTLKALLGGAAAFGLALCAYDLLAFAGAAVQWELLVRQGATSFLAAAAIGLVEEGAKLAGILLVVDRGLRPRVVAAAAVGVAAGFSALETLLVVGGEWSAAALARTALGPLAHGLLAVPLVTGVVAWGRCGRGARGLAALLLSLAVSAALHGAGDLSLASPAVGAAGYAAALCAPALFLFLGRNAKGPLCWRTLRTHRE
jgi:hypothetical protein